ncbi:MAG: helix-turn-helix transcriptional regulator, partial [Spirochaetales bacterium]|nr:helix-turn-helix transcriptional regulator [Spirochaetales bacterium]
ILILQDELYSDLGTGRITMEYPPRHGSALPGESAGDPVFPGSIPVKHLVTRHNGSFSYVMKILYHREKYIGIVMLEAGPRNIAIYDMLCLLLSQALYGNYLKENRVFSSGEKKALLHSSTFRSILETGSSSERGGGALTTGKILEYLTDHLGEKTNIALMARDLGLSESNLMIKTKKLTGCTVQTLHEMLKIERAKMLLARNEISIAEIAGKTGFINQSYFAKVFRKHTGVSPGQWVRQKHGT